MELIEDIRFCLSKVAEEKTTNLISLKREKSRLEL
ncbi:hypothetical protein F383_09580 [Gossypium arboreum]|uniref:Uncharacterized protein n=1 Tax=Gossypium arboreum TaxID=29729 RepID=A0A0B0NTV2_GOSAR|nr:hypothetical protein F383_09580 [Gossypium arboreum]